MIPLTLKAIVPRKVTSESSGTYFMRRYPLSFEQQMILPFSKVLSMQAATVKVLPKSPYRGLFNDLIALLHISNNAVLYLSSFWIILVHEGC
jgi:hypothetical protein